MNNNKGLGESMKTNYNSLINDISKSLNSIYLLYGDEQYLVQTAINRIKKQFGELVQGINYILIDDTNINNLISDIEMPAFGYDRKLILVRNSGLFKKDGRRKTLTPDQEKLFNYLSQKENVEFINENVVIIFVEQSADNNSVFEVISKIGVVCEIQELQVPELKARLKQICAMYKVGADDSTLEYLIERSGTNLEVLINEIRKLIEYAGENGKIDKQSVNNLAIKQIDSVVFDLTDNLANKKIDKALVVLDELIYQKIEILVILKTLYTHFKKLYLCADALKTGQNITGVLGLKPNQTFLVNKYKNQLRYFDEKVLRKLLDEFVELDYNYKTAKIDIDLGLRSILCTYCSANYNA